MGATALVSAGTLWSRRGHDGARKAVSPWIASHRYPPSQAYTAYERNSVRQILFPFRCQKVLVSQQGVTGEK